mmetsp:Transcript_11196/g.12835  ORF Transcript_11196/g.12835 Transcript_11196/m.12835 type:complete len:423 (+) Transcript_11196:65-1333(+)
MPPPALRRKVYVVGGHITKFIGAKHPDFIWKKHPEFGKKENPILEDYIYEAVNETLKATDTPAELVDKAWIGNFAGELFSSQGHLGAAVAGSNDGLYNKPIMRVEGACASGGLAFASAIDSIQAGCDINLVVGAEVQTTASARQGGDYLARASDYKRQRSIDDFVFPAMFARRTMHCMEKMGVQVEDLAKLSVKAYENANKNPLAHMHHVKMDMDLASSSSDKNPAILGNPELNPFLRVSDCSQVSDGGAALVVVSEDGLKKLGKSVSDAIELVGIGHATGNLFVDGDPLSMPTTAFAASQAYDMSTITPADVQVAEVHDCFTITEILMMDSLKLAQTGSGLDMVRNGETTLEGRVPVNTGGGLVGFGHPVGATGIKQVLEIYRQMKGQCGDYQMKNQPEIGVTANMGGDDKTAVVGLFKNH